MRQITLAVSTSGVDGSATGTETTNYPLDGRLAAIHLDYSATQAATTDVTVTGGNPATTLLTVTDNKTDGWYYPHAVAQDAAGANVTYDGTRPIYIPTPLAGYLTVAVAQADDGETVTVTVLWED